jgi:hypothetical protein
MINEIINDDEKGKVKVKTNIYDMNFLRILKVRWRSWHICLNKVKIDKYEWFEYRRIILSLGEYVKVFWCFDCIWKMDLNEDRDVWSYWMISECEMSVKWEWKIISKIINNMLGQNDNCENATWSTNVRHWMMEMRRESLVESNRVESRRIESSRVSSSGIELS